MKRQGLAVCLAVFGACEALAAERVALVVGNAQYEHASPLANPSNDAQDMAALLRRLGFEVTVGIDVTNRAMADQIRTFSRQARAARVALFFYAGHGLQVGGVNYLVPVDARLAEEDDLDFEAVALGLVLKRMGGGTNLVFLDACRDNPFARNWAATGRSTSAGRGLTRVDKAGGGGLFIAFATDPDSVAADGEGRNSPFTAALARHIETPGLEINGLLTEVRRTVLASTGNVQRPWSNSSLSHPFYFVAPASPPDTGVGAPDPEAEMWLQIRETTDAGLLESFLATFPNGRYSGAARARLDALRQAPFTVVAASPQPPTVPSESGSQRPQPPVGKPFRDCAECPEMVVVPAGSYRMGSPSGELGRDDDEGPVHEVTFGAPFAMGVYEVTFAEWDACAHAGGCPRGQLIAVDRGWGRGRRPVISATWNDAQAYAMWLSRKTGKRYRLPSESEWEYAARAGTATAYSWGDRVGVNLANCDGCGSRWDDDSTAPVGSFAANPWGLHDMLGNVWELTQDCWNGNYRGAPADGSAWESVACAKRVVRGGSWDDPPSYLRAAQRGRVTARHRIMEVHGFRVARTLVP